MRHWKHYSLRYFLVLVGMQVNLSTFLELGTFAPAISLTVVAIVGKFVSDIFVGREVDRCAIGIVMIPRGEVGLIFVSLGKGLGVVTDVVFSTVVIMVIATTLMSTMSLKWSLIE